jgi:hypothetical protein
MKTMEKLEPIDLPDGTFPAILTEELYQRILARSSMNIQFAQRNAQEPEAFLLRAGFLRCARCKRLMAAIASNKRELKNDGSGEYYTWTKTYYKCSNPQCPLTFRCPQSHLTKRYGMLWYH